MGRRGELANQVAVIGPMFPLNVAFVAKAITRLSEVIGKVPADLLIALGQGRIGLDQLRNKSRQAEIDSRIQEIAGVVGTLSSQILRIGTNQRTTGRVSDDVAARRAAGD